jgi:hypothetical protein
LAGADTGVLRIRVRHEDVLTLTRTFGDGAKPVSFAFLEHSA